MKENINKLFDLLFPINRSLINSGFDKSLNIICKNLGFKIEKVRSGSKVFDWTVPYRWEIKDGYIEDSKKIKIVDFKKNNLSVMGYSSPINKFLDFKDLKKNLHFIKNKPNWIPYVTSYYKKNWGFSLSYNDFKKLKKGKYKVYINSSFEKNYLKYGLKILKGKSNKIILISTYLCHPSMANNELSGPLVMRELIKKIKNWKNRYYTYYFLINPETIGSICFIKKYHKILKKNMEAGMVLTCLGGKNSKLSYKMSRKSNSSLDKLFTYLASKNKVKIREFDPSSGSDERQFCSSLLNLPMGQIARDVYGIYEQYHTSADNKKYMNIDQLINSINKIENYLEINEILRPLERAEPYCEIQLSKHDLYPTISSLNTLKNSNDKLKDQREQLKIISYILSYADKKNTIIDISKKLDIDLDKVINIYYMLVNKKILI